MHLFDKTGLSLPSSRESGQGDVDTESNKYKTLELIILMIKSSSCCILFKRKLNLCHLFI